MKPVVRATPGPWTSPPVLLHTPPPKPGAQQVVHDGNNRDLESQGPSLRSTLLLLYLSSFPPSPPGLYQPFKSTDTKPVTHGPQRPTARGTRDHVGYC